MHSLSTKEKISGHLMAILTIIVWGTTFIATKLLLDSYSPIQIMVMRFTLAYVVLFLLNPKPLLISFKEEIRFFLLGLSGCTVYFLTENSALRYTYAANVSIILSAAPILTALLAHLFLKGQERVGKHNIIGFLVAFAGIVMVVFNGTVVLKLNPLGDLLTLGSALSWAVYSILVGPALARYDSIRVTRRLILWGLITSLPVAVAEGHAFSLTPLADGTLLFCILFLGVLGSGVCYVTWNVATRRLGVVLTNNYIYVSPFVTMLTAAIVLHELVTLMGIIGAVLIICGVIFSDKSDS